MRLVIILLLSLCSFVTKDNDHSRQVKSNRLLSYLHFDNKNKNDAFLQSNDISDRDDLAFDIDDDDTNHLFARKYTLAIKYCIIQCYLQLNTDRQGIDEHRFSCSPCLNIPTDRYITQRVLRI